MAHHLFNKNIKYAQIAQLVEQGTENPRVLGSIPSLGTTYVKKQRSNGSTAAFLSELSSLPCVAKPHFSVDRVEYRSFFVAPFRRDECGSGSIPGNPVKRDLRRDDLDDLYQLVRIFIDAFERTVMRHCFCQPRTADQVEHMQF